MKRVFDASGENLIPFVSNAVVPGSVVRTDSWGGYNELQELGYVHEKVNISASGDPAHVLMPGVHRIASLLKRWLFGTHQGTVSAKELGLGDGQLETIKYAALLHDIGKIGIKDAVLLKNGPFTPEERDEMNRHPAKTLGILKQFHFPKHLEQVPLVAAHHHEKADGSGYFKGVARDKIPFGSRILAVADVFDALTSRRDYPKYTKDEILKHGPMPLVKAIMIMKEGAGNHFDPEVITAFMNCLPKMLTLYRSTHFLPEYVDEMIASLEADKS